MQSAPEQLRESDVCEKKKNVKSKTKKKQENAAEAEKPFVVFHWDARSNRSALEQPHESRFWCALKKVLRRMKYRRSFRARLELTPYTA